jgi:TonB family protein
MGGLRAAWAFLRAQPERLKRPESLLMLLALLASLGAHMPPWVGLGALADYFSKHEEARSKSKPVEVSFDITEPAKPSEPEVPPVEPAKPLVSKRDKRAKLEKPKPVEKAKLERVPPPEEKKEPDPRVSEVTLPKPPEPPAPMPDPQLQRKQSITQKSIDPNIEPPPNAEYLADENQRVEEETVAKVTSETKNDPDIQEAAPEAPGPEKSGDSLEQERGAEHGGDTPEQVASEARAAQPPPSATQPTPRPAQPPREAHAEVTSEPLVVRDALGTFVIQAPRKAQGAQAGHAGTAGAHTTQDPNLKVSWSAFEQTYGAEQLAQDRMPREAKRRGAGHEKRWNEFRAAVENYVAGVKPGNTTALNAAADPFAMYLAAFHRNLHTEFAYEFIGSLPLSGGLANMDLVAKVEIVVNPDGSLDRVGVVKSSGNLMYDFGAFNAVQRGAPYPPPPEKIRSPDGRTYLRWALHRNESQCGTWNAEPYILKNPPRSPNDPKQDNVSPYRAPGQNGEHGQNAPRDEPRPGKGGGQGPAVQPGDTLGSFRSKKRGLGVVLLVHGPARFDPPFMAPSPAS